MNRPCVDTLEKIEPAQTLPVTVAEVLKHCRLDGMTEHEDELTDILRDAIDYVESETDLTLCVSKYRWTLDYFPSCALTLPIRPVLSASIRYRDTAGTWQTVDEASYQLHGLANPPLLRLNPLNVWPTTQSDVWSAVEIELVGGHNGTDNVPSQAKRAILLIAGHWFVNREALLTGTISKEIELGVSSLLAQIAGREVV